MPNCCEDFKLSVLGLGRFIHSRAEFCFSGVCMPGHASNMSDTIKSITSLLFLLVETSTAQFLCSNEALFGSLTAVFVGFGEKISIIF